MAVPMTSGPPRWRRFLVRAIQIAVASLAVTMLCSFTIDRWFARRDLAAAIAAIDAREPEWRLESLEAQRPVVPADANSALIIKKAVESLPDRDWTVPEEEPAAPPCRRMETEYAKRVRSAIEAAAKSLDIARTLTAFPRGRFEAEYTPDFFRTRIEEQQQARRIVLLLQADARLRAEAGDLAGAMASAHALKNTASALDSEVTLIGQFIRLSMLSYLVETLERNLGLGATTSDVLEAWRPWLADESAKEAVFRGLRGDLAGLHHLFHNVHSEGLSYLVSFGKEKTPREPTLWDRCQEVLIRNAIIRSDAWLINWRDELLEPDDLTGHARYLAIEQLGHRFQELYQAEKHGSNRFAVALLPSFRKIADVERRTRTRLDCARCAFAAEAFRLRNKRWPNDAQELLASGLLAALPEDLFDGEPLRIRRAKDGIVVHSVDRRREYAGDALDDLNDLPAPTMNWRAEFRLWDPELRGQASSKRIDKDAPPGPGE